MPPAPIDIVRQELSRDPREFEYIDLGDTDGWSQDQKQEVVAELLDAANRGDARVPVALFGLMPREWLRATFEKLLAASSLAVRIEAAAQLQKLLASQLETALESAIGTGQLDESGLRRATDLLLAAGDDSCVWRLVRDTQKENVRTVLLDRLWNHARFYLYPSVWWSGLGLLKTRLMVPLASFRAPLIDELQQLAASGLIADKYPPQSGSLPPALVAAMRDVEDGTGPIADPPLSDDEKQALTAYAAKWALSERSARAVAYVAHLDGAAHRNLFEWAAQQADPTLAQAGKDALTGIQ